MREHFWQRLLQASVCVIAIALPLSACSGPTKTAWAEEIQFSDGRITTIKRTSEVSAKGEMGGPVGFSSLKMSISFLPDLADAPPRWEGASFPMVLDFDHKKNEWFIVATLPMCSDIRRMGLSMPYIEYRARGGEWHQVPSSSDAVGRVANLAMSLNLETAEPGLLTIDKKRKRVSRLAPYKQTVLGSWKNPC